MHFDLIPIASKDGRSAAGAEEPVLIASRFAADCNRLPSVNGGGVEQRTMVLSAIETVAYTNPQRIPRCHQSNLSALAPA